MELPDPKGTSPREPPSGGSGSMALWIAWGDEFPALEEMGGAGLGEAFEAKLAVADPQRGIRGNGAAGLPGIRNHPVVDHPLVGRDGVAGEPPERPVGVPRIEEGARELIDQVLNCCSGTAGNRGGNQLMAHDR